ncbi:camp-dependent protein kinase catalytic subunit, partial [Nowakowskiella sp. JEL0078]
MWNKNTTCATSGRVTKESSRTMRSHQIFIFISIQVALLHCVFAQEENFPECVLPTALKSTSATWSGASIGLNTCGQACVSQQNCYNCMSPNPLTDSGQEEIFTKYLNSFCGETWSLTRKGTVATTSAAKPAVISSVAAVTTRATTVPVIATTIKVVPITATNKTNVLPATIPPILDASLSTFAPVVGTAATIVPLLPSAGSSIHQRHIKVADFGFAKRVTNTTNSFCGTPDYIAVEVVLSRAYTKAVDWWSLGVLVFELVSGKTPFGDETSDRVYENIATGKIKWNPLIKGNCRLLIRSLLESDANDRLGSPKRGGAEEIKAHPWFKGVSWPKVEARQTQPPHVPTCDLPDVIERERVASEQKSKQP